MMINSIKSEILCAVYKDNLLIYVNERELQESYLMNNKTDSIIRLSLFTSLNDVRNLMADDKKYKGIEKLLKKPRSKLTKVEIDLIFIHDRLKDNLDDGENTEKDKEAEEILKELIADISFIEEEIKQTGDSITNAENMGLITSKRIIKKINQIDENITKSRISRVELAELPSKSAKTTITLVQFTNNPNLADGLYKEIATTDDKGNTNIKLELVGNITLQELTLTYDKAGIIKKPVATLKYTNTAINQSITLNKEPFEIIASHLVNNRLIDRDNKGVEGLLNKIWVNGVGSIEFITAETDLLKDGFFMDIETNKVLTNNVFTNLKTSTEEVRKAINLFNELLKGRGTAIPNDCILFRFMLWSPFATVLKQMGFIEGLYSMVLWGVTDTSKTGSSVMFSYLYTDKATTLQKANTQSAIGTRLGENTFPLILDEAKDNLLNPNDEEFNKNIVTDMMGRAVKDRTNNEAMIEFPAFRLTVRTLNQDITYKGEFLKRHRVLYYDQSMQVKEEDKIEFNKKYKPNSPATPLHQLKHLGKAFADRFIPYLESQSDELYNLDNLTIKILGEIEKEYNTKFNTNVLLPHKDRLTAQSDDTTSLIKTGLNEMFIKGYKIPYGRNYYDITDFISCTNIGAVRWLDYQKKNQLFIIKVNEFEKDISDIAGQHIPIAETMKLLNIKYDDNNGKKIKFKGVPTKAVKISIYNLTYRLFGIRVRDFEELQAEEEEKEREEAEAE